MKNNSTKYCVLVIYSVAIKRFLRNLLIIAIFLGYHDNRNEKYQNRTENQIKSHLYDIRYEKNQLNPFIENFRKKWQGLP